MSRSRFPVAISTTSRHLARTARRVVPGLAALLAVLLVPALAVAAGDTGGAGDAVRADCNPDGWLAHGWLWLYLAAFGNGVLTSLTPCVYPMIPITVAVFGARDEGVTRLKAITLATCYVTGMGVMYASLGVVVTLLGQQFGTFLANPFVVIPLVIVFLALAASMFGAFELQLPASWQARLNQVGGKGFAGAFGMGLVGGMVAAPCTGPFLALILGPVMQTRNVVAGGTLLFTYALGIGLLFWVIAAFAVSLPRSGRWMEWIKSFGGVALLAVSLYFLRPIVPAITRLTSPGWQFLLGAVVVGAIGIAAGAIHLSFHSDWSTRVRKALAIALVLVGTTGVINNLLTPDRHLPWQTDEQAVFAQARAQGKGVMLDFAADWCLPCKELELTFADGEVFRAIEANFLPLKVDVTHGTDEDEAKQEHWNAHTLPAVIFADASGKELARVDTFVRPAEFLVKLREAVDRMNVLLARSDPCPDE